MLGSLILYLKGMRIMMFQLSGYYRNKKGAPFWHWVMVFFRNLTPQHGKKGGDQETLTSWMEKPKSISFNSSDPCGYLRFCVYLRGYGL